VSEISENDHSASAAAKPAGAFHLATLENGWTVGRFRALEELKGFAHVVTTRLGLDVDIVRSDPVAAADRLGAAVGVKQAAFCNQVHGPTVRVVCQGGPAGSADGLVSRTPGLALVTRSADCPLILAADPVSGVFGAAHASWRGTVARIAAGLIGQMTGQGALAENIVACICPSAGPCCYEVGPEVLDAAMAGIGPHAGQFFTASPAQPGRPGKPAMHFDLWSSNTDQLLRAGLGGSNIHVAGLCTLCRNDLFPSHRLEGDRAGRFAAVIAGL